MISIYTDGGSRGNPGSSAIGVVIKDEEGDILFELGKDIGFSTNNIAEYKAAIEALSWVAKHIDIAQKENVINFYTDSLLMYSQITGFYKVKSATLKGLLLDLKKQEELVGIPIRYFRISRELNKEADKLVNNALDKQVRG